MVSRRTIFGALAAAAAGLSGCGLGGGSLDSALTAAAEGVDGVTSASLEQATEAEFRRIIRGEVQTDAADRPAALEIFDGVMSALVGAVRERRDAEDLLSRAVDPIALHDAAGTAYSVWDLRPDLEAERTRTGRVSLSDFA
ncbi:hypothetical protein [Brachybacterium hainanense]|uniref:Uncharacterized protein n=1 Tax=Brachybacterium hainanense TaxID=1541174 RepID=A0ABV6REX8_9MICO